MKAEEAKKMTDEALAKLAAALAEGKSEALTAYLGTMAKFHRYSFGNVMLILFQRPDATRVAGFHAWRDLGRYVKKGEHGIAILAPMLLRQRDAEPKDGETVEPRKVLRFRVVHVFDVSQTDGEPLPAFARVSGDPGVCTDRLRTHIASRGITLVYEDSLGGAEGMSSGGTIKVRSGLPAAEEFSVLVHELAHEVLHHGEGAQRGTKTVRETEAEAVAFVVTHAVGLHNGTASADYIRLYDGDTKTLAASLDRIQKTAAAVIGAVVGDGDATAETE